MDKNKLIWIIATVIILVIVVYSFQGGESEEAYVERITMERDDKDRFMRTDSESPFFGQLETYNGLKYYPPVPELKINARFSEIEEKERMTLPTSDGKTRDYLEYGYAQFVLEDKEQRLLILEDLSGKEGESKLFLAFGDATSAVATYGGGRYMDLKHNGGRNIILDFNQAYNPYCAYSEKFVCPFPPKENLLEVAITAGEKMYE